MPLRLEGTATTLAENHSRQASILLVEDNDDDVLLTLRAFEKSAFDTGQVEVVRDGAQARDYLFARGPFESRNSALVPKLILLDINLPKLGGLELLEVIRSDPRTRLIPVVMLSSSVADPDLLCSYRQGANGYIRKPVNSKQFEEVVEQVARYWLGINRSPGAFGGDLAGMHRP